MPQQKRKRGRPAAAFIASPEAQDASQHTTNTQRPRKRAKPAPPPSGPGRPAGKSRGKVQAESTPTSSAKAGPPSRRPRPSLQDVQPDEAQNHSTQKADGRRGKRGSKGGQGDDTKADATQRKRGPRSRGRPSLNGTERQSSAGTTQLSQQQQSQEQSQEQESAPRRRRRSSAATAEPEDAPPPSPPKPYPHISRRTRRIRRSHISSKWSPLTAPSLSAANTILTLAHRPILQRLSRTSQRRQHTFAALRLITTRINRRLARGIPFPPSSTATGSGSVAAGARETELDFEGVLDGRAALERQLDPALHAVELLKREKKRMEGELERDYETLRNLEAGARGQARQQRDLLKKAHVLAPEGSKRVGDEEKDEAVFKREDTDSNLPLFTALQDDEMKDAALQLGGHIDSMRMNLQQAEGIMPEIAKSRAALQSVLMKHLDVQQYERSVLG